MVGSVGMALAAVLTPVTHLTSANLQCNVRSITIEYTMYHIICSSLG